MPPLSLLLPTLWRLGPRSVAAVAMYRLACKAGIYRALLPIRRQPPAGDTFVAAERKPIELAGEEMVGIIAAADMALDGRLAWYSWAERRVGSPPDWFRDPLENAEFRQAVHWSCVDEFAATDIKNIWEASRFQWAPRFAQAWRLTGEEGYLDALNVWVADWLDKNPDNQGPNWKCAQEASIRLLHLLQTAYLLDAKTGPAAPLLGVVEAHCRRIAPTMSYAVAQKNNHATSEAAALFIGGAWLCSREVMPAVRRRAAAWCRTGRRRLEQLLRSLVAEDGSFSQYSTNYHRVLLDTLCQVEFWRSELSQAPFSETFRSRCRAATEWLGCMIDRDSGCVPNIGANDGARLYDLSGLPYEDYRPTLQLASVLFRGGIALDQGGWDAPLRWLGRATVSESVPLDKGSRLFPDGGYAVLRAKDSWCVIRFANFRFRPVNADCAHVDLWHAGNNVLRDGGSFSYNTDARWLDYFSGTESHNTVQFDDRNQMPRLGRFLFGDWLSMRDRSGIRQQAGVLSWTGAYEDRHGARHRRTVSVAETIWRVTDEITGFSRHAVIRWRLAPDEWVLEGSVCAGRLARLRVSSPGAIERIELTRGWESRHYQMKTRLPVLEVETKPGSWTVETEIMLNV